MEKVVVKIANVLISNVWGEVGPDSLEKGIGGREGSMIYLSREWARLGHEVTSFVNCERGKRFEEEFDVENNFGSFSTFRGFHEYIPLNMTKGMLNNFPYDVLIAWECPSIFRDPITRENVGLKVCEMQVAHFMLTEMRAANEFCDYLTGLSNWHCEFLIHQGIDLPRERVVTLPNAVDMTRYWDHEKGWKNKRSTPKKNWKFIYSSSPDRGLWHLLKCWPNIKKMNPKASLLVTYGVKKWIDQVRYSHGRVAEMAVELERLMDQPGIKNIGVIGQQKLSQHQINADAWLYPFDPIQPTETGCITAIENSAAGNPIITTDGDCMEDEFGEVGVIMPLPFDVDNFSEAINQVMNDDSIYGELQQKGYEFASNRTWEKVAPKWIELFGKEVTWNGKKSTLTQPADAAIVSGAR